MRVVIVVPRWRSNGNVVTNTKQRCQQSLNNIPLAWPGYSSEWLPRPLLAPGAKVQIHSTSCFLNVSLDVCMRLGLLWSQHGVPINGNVTTNKNKGVSRASPIDSQHDLGTRRNDSVGRCEFPDLHVTKPKIIFKFSLDLGIQVWLLWSQYSVPMDM